MKILLIFPALLPYGIQLANALNVEHEVYFLTNSSGNDLLPSTHLLEFPQFLRDQLDPKIRLKIFPFKKFSNICGWSQIIYTLKIIREFNPEIIHLNQTYDPRFLIPLNIIKNKFPLVLSIHDVIWQHGSKPNLREIMKDNPLKIADKILVHGKKLKDLLIQEYPKLNPNDITIIPHGPYTFYRQWIRNTIKNDFGKILFFGRMQPYKGLETIVKVGEILEESYPEAKIVIAGSGPELDSRISELETKRNFEIHNHFIENKLVARLFQEATIIALPYEEASQSGVAAIAMAFNKPVVATNVGSLPEMIEDGYNGFIVERGQPDVFAQRTKFLLENTEVLKKIQMNTIEFTKQNSWDAIREKINTVYQTFYKKFYEEEN